MVLEFDLLALTRGRAIRRSLVRLLSKECWQKSIVSEYYEQRRALSRFTLGALLMTDTVLEVVRRELRRVASVKVDVEQVRAVLQSEV